MERSGTHPPGALHATELLDLLRSPGPFATIWASASSPTPNHVGSAATAATRGLAHEAFDDEVRREVEQLLQDRLAGAGGVVVVADPSGVRLVETLTGAPRRAVTHVDALPSLSPVVEHRQADVPFVVVMADRLGADVYWSTAQGDGSDSVAADPDHPITKVRSGGWSHRRMQQRAENSWEQTAGDVVASVVAIAEQITPRVVAVGGDVRMLQLIHDRLPDRVRDAVREIPGSRAEDGSAEQRDDAVRRWVRTAVAEDTVALLQLFGQEDGRHARAANGAADTFAALRESRVDVLLVHDDGEVDDGGDRAWFSASDPSLVAIDAGLLRDLGVDEPREARRVDVAICAALATGAGVRVVPHAGPVRDGLGAVLRW
jgi:hypothetical protein